MKRPFVINCFSGTGRYPCNVTYEVVHDLGVSYRLFPKYKGSSAPIDSIIEIDESIRQAIFGAIIKDYPWPDK